MNGVNEPHSCLTLGKTYLFDPQEPHLSRLRNSWMIGENTYLVKKNSLTSYDYRLL